MHVEAQRVVEWLTARGDLETAFEVEGALPPHLDIENEEHRDLLAQHGVPVDALVAELDATRRL
jgi:hypothetical protein